MKKIRFKTHKVIKAGLMIGLIAFISSCDWIDPDMNIDPDRPADVSMALLVPGIQQVMGWAMMGNSTVRDVDMWVQIFDGVSRQSTTEGRYRLVPGDVNDAWANIYTQVFNNAKFLLDKAVAEESPHNQGLAKVMIAWSLAISTDLWGDIPYSEALDPENLTPVYDSQEEIYNTIFTLLDEAVTDLGADEPVGIGGDVIYGGDADAWINAARAIKARAELQLSKRNGATAYNNALALTDAFTSNADDMEVPYEQANQNPVYLFMQDRTDIRMSQTLLDEMSAVNDPRIPFYYGLNADGAITGAAPGMEDESASPPGSYIAGETAPSILMSYAELKFIEAEAAFMTGATSRAVDAYKEGVTASVEKVTGASPDSAFTADVIDAVTAANISMDDIIMQKRHALVGQIQPFSDWRRTGIPSLSLVNGATTTAIPRRFPYSQNEIIYNGDNVPDIGNILSRVWWDAQ